jgi:AcrR family transcriptional regulator
MAPKNDVSEERKDQILNAARKTFSTKGIYKTRMSDIAETSGLSKGALYWYFKSKDDIILSLLEKIFEPELKDLKKVLAEDRPTAEKLLGYAERYGQDIANTLKWMPLIYDFIALAFRQEKIKQAISIYYQKHLKLLEDLIQQGIDLGEFQAESALQAAFAMGSIVEGTILLWMYEPDNIDIKEHVISNTRLLLQGLQIRTESR